MINVQLSLEILMLVAQDGGKMTLLTQQITKLTLSIRASAEYRQIIDKPTHVVKDSLSCINIYYILYYLIRTNSSREN